jgi:excisionase family DNA binding protein
MGIFGTGLSHDELDGVRPLAITVSTARKLTGLGNTTIWALIKNGKLKSVCVGRRRLITYASLEALLSPPTDAPQPRRKRGRPRKPSAVVKERACSA